MTNEETAVLCRYVRSLCPAQRFDEYTADVWHDILRDYLLDEARAAAVAIASKQTFVAPGEIATEIKRTRADRMSRHTDPTPAADPDDPHAYRAEIAATRYAVATGQTEPAPAELTAGPMHPDVAARLKTLGSYVPRHVDDELDAYRPIKAARRAAILANQPDALAVPCGYCKAPTGKPCRINRLDPTNGLARSPRATPHPTRIDDARTYAEPEANA
ncbi:zinc finger domain-containing protein [Streptomyces parvulus]|uniref:zinc finger domain-containing protein n=1 Tax=Streptomyces parvulus TaxID=146923 RepID=UPI003717B597